MTKKDIILAIEKTIKQLSSDPKEADTIKALQKQIDNLKPCKYGTYTNDLFHTNGCKTCGSPKVVLCSNKKTIADRFSSKYCNSINCKHFEITNGLQRKL